MIKISNLRLLDGVKIHFTFSDNKEKIVDFAPFIKDDKLSSALKDQVFFKQVKIYENGRGIYWPNDFDFCPDFLYKYQPENKEELLEKN
jgi:hypothetical protein